MSVREEVQLDFDRPARLGITEAILCAHKTPVQINEILTQVLANGGDTLLTRLTKEKRARLKPAVEAEFDYDALSQTAFFNHSRVDLQPARPGRG